MIRWLPLLLSATAVAAPLRPHDAHRFGDSLVHVEKTGDGLPPDDADEVTYRWDTFKDRDPKQATHEEKTRRMLDQNDRIREHLLVMKPGEVRWIWFAEQDGMLCDHFGCAHGPDAWAAKLELVSVTRHEDDIPDDMHITAWPFLGVRRGKTWAALPANQVKSIDSVRLRNGVVVITDSEERFPGTGKPLRVSHSVSLAELRARLADEDGLAALRAKNLRAANQLFAKAVELDDALNLPHLHLALTQALLKSTPIDMAALQRDPVGSYWRVMFDDMYTALRTNPAIRGLVARTPGASDEAIDYRCQSMCMEVDPSGRFAVTFVSNAFDSEFRLSFGALRVIDLQTSAIVSTIPLDDSDSKRGHDGTERCVKCKQLLAAQKTLTDLGFTPIKPSAVTITLLDPQGRNDHPLIEFADGLALARAGDKPSRAKKFIAIDEPEFARIPAAQELTSLVIFRWTSGSTNEVSLVPR